MTIKQAEQELDEVVERKVRKRVGIKVMRDIHQQVDEIKKQEATEQGAKKIMIPLLLLASAVVIILVFSWTDVIRIISGLIA